MSGWVPIQSAADAQADIGISSTGGGPSNCAIQSSDNASCVSGFTQPTWQTVSIPGQLNARLSPDVSFLATPNYPGYIFCTPQSELGLTGTTSSCSPGGAAGITNALNPNNPSIIGGTSASAPVFAGIVALLNQYLGTTTGLGNVNPMLYTLALNPSNGAFNPVTTGDNNVACQVGSPAGTATDPWPTALQCPASGVFGFSASSADTTTSYNLVAGLGSVDVNNLAVAWKQLATQPGFSVSPSTSALTVVAGSASNSTTLTATPVNGFSGTVTYTCTARAALGRNLHFHAHQPYVQLACDSDVGFHGWRPCHHSHCHWYERRSIELNGCELGCHFHEREFYSRTCQWESPSDPRRERQRDHCPHWRQWLQQPRHLYLHRPGDPVDMYRTSLRNGCNLSQLHDHNGRSNGRGNAEFHAHFLCPPASWDAWDIVRGPLTQAFIPRHASTGTDRCI